MRPPLRRGLAGRRARVCAHSPAEVVALGDLATTCSWAAQKYAEELAVQPLLTHVATASLLFLAGDAFSQLRAGGVRAYDARRAASMGLFAAVYTGVFQAWWFDQLNRVLPNGDTPVLELCTAVAKTAACQLGPIPLAYLPLLFAVQGLVRGLGWERTVEHARESYWPLLRRNWQYWWPVQTVQFALVPADWQLPFVCSAAVVWAVILSSAAEPAAGARQPAEAVLTPEPEELVRTDRAWAGQTLAARPRELAGERAQVWGRRERRVRCVGAQAVSAPCEYVRVDDSR